MIIYYIINFVKLNMTNCIEKKFIIIFKNNFKNSKLDFK